MCCCLIFCVQVDLDVLSESYRCEQKEYYLATSAWADVHPSQLLGPGVCFKKYDLLTITIDELKVGAWCTCLAGGRDAVGAILQHHQLGYSH
jgi:hypothetical protein